MANKNEGEQQQQQPTVQSQLSQAFWTIISMVIYVALGLTLCYLKIMFGDMCRAPNINHTVFTDPNQPYPVDQQETTPSLPYYCKDDSTNYVKQLFMADPNFITAYAQFRGKTSEDGKKIPPTYTENETSQMFKAFFLETSYILFSVTSILQSIPDWLIILVHPVIWGFTLLGMFIFTWLISSYNIFSYFLKSDGIFARWYVGWLAGFIAWFVFMFVWGAITVPIGVISGFGQLIILLSKQQVRVLDPSVDLTGQYDPPNDTQYKPYSFSKYFLDMLKTNPIIHLILMFTIYNIFEKMTRLISISFSKQFSYAFLAILVILLVWYKGRFSFIPKNQLNENGWTSHLEPISIPYEKPGDEVNDLLQQTNKLIELAKKTAPQAVGKVISVASNLLPQEQKNNLAKAVFGARLGNVIVPPASTAVKG
jgi:hypothetical protein